MKVKILPINGGFINRILYFNLSDEMFDNQELFFDKNISLAVVLDGGYIVAVDLWDYKFWVYDPKVKDYYGPYNTYQEAICTHLFGMFDGLFHLMKNIKLNKEINVYEFEFEGFRYTPFTYRFTASIKKTAVKMDKTLTKIKDPFQFTFKPETDFGDNVISNFLIRLDKIFQINNFDSFFKDSKFNTLIRIDRLTIDGYRVDKKPFVVANINKDRHLFAYIPKLIHKSYFNWVDLSNSDEDFKKVFTDETVTITNANDVIKAKQLFDIDINKVEVTLNKIDIVKYLHCIVSRERNNVIDYILNVDGVFYKLSVDLQKKTFVFKEFEDYNVYDSSVKLNENKDGVIISKEDTATDKDVLIVSDDNSFEIDYSTELCKLKNNYIVDIEYLNNISLA